MRKITHLITHHSASRGTIEEFRRLHIVRLGARDIGYHNVIGSSDGAEEGIIATGGPHAQVGAGVYESNNDKLQVCVIGNFEKGTPGAPDRPVGSRCTPSDTGCTSTANVMG